MPSRLDIRPVMINDDEGYKKEFFQEKGVNHISQYGTAKMRYPTPKEISKIETSVSTWKRGSRLYKLAAEHYGDPSLWWVIAWFNQKPTDSHYSFGDKVLIPSPIEELLSYYRVY